MGILWAHTVAVGCIVIYGTRHTALDIPILLLTTHRAQ